MTQLPYRETGRRGRKAVAHEMVDGKELKYCGRCTKWRALEMFHNRSTTWDGLASHCIGCATVNARASRERGQRPGVVHRNRIAPGARYLRTVWLGSRRKAVTLYKVWDGILMRCTYQRQQNYAYYGGRGIRVCAAWTDSYDAFRAWAVANGFRKGLTIDRIDKDGHYEPSNCRWVTRSEQMLNTRRTVNLETFS